MAKFPVDAPKRKVVKTLELLGFRIVREREHISMVRQNPDGSKTPPNDAEPPDAQGFHAQNDLHPSQNFTRRVSRCL